MGWQFSSGEDCSQHFFIDLIVNWPSGFNVNGAVSVLSGAKNERTFPPLQESVGFLPYPTMIGAKEEKEVLNIYTM